MTILSWNCRGLGNLRNLQFLKDLVIQKRPKIVFLCETLCGKEVVERAKFSLGFDSAIIVEAQGHSGGIALLWKNKEEPVWRLVGMYGEPNTSLRHNTWRLIKHQAQDTRWPWAIIGDLNNVTSQDDKHGGRPYPISLIQGFNQILFECELTDMELVGHPYAWEKSRGTSRWVEVRLDRALVSKQWLEVFNSSKLFNLNFSSSDHCPIYLESIIVKNVYGPKKFKFENAWLREPLCLQVVKDVWEREPRLDDQNKIKMCGDALSIYGKDYIGDFNTRIKEAKLTLKQLKGRRDEESVKQYDEAEKSLFEILTQRELFATSHSMGDEVHQCIDPCISPKTNDWLMKEISDEEVRSAVFQMHPDKAPGPDGMTPGFYQKYWKVVGSDVIKLVRSYFGTSTLPESLNDTSLVLIPKKSNPVCLADLRPISFMQCGV
ncbi:uncharacterized protein LOC133031961 [Cannabis sativa]|uniref:uncharacterized protein LOC133031961 n=1 Tax=Cannabis sativa TaxID=3483 RepID=UPI0029C9C0AF|nr:uncharacterized protein LOC133031961 [Cannabis sativa]